eukprot:scaffold11794_cov133-Skeletonema_marinoi.AAC.7
MENTNKECGSCGRKSDDLKICTGCRHVYSAAETSNLTPASAQKGMQPAQERTCHQKEAV